VESAELTYPDVLDMVGICPFFICDRLVCKSDLGLTR
jgi:hypothetical protein